MRGQPGFFGAEERLRWLLASAIRWNGCALWWTQRRSARSWGRYCRAPTAAAVGARPGMRC